MGRCRPARRPGHLHPGRDGRHRRARRWTRPRTTGASARSGPVELERAMAALGVTEWENLGYHDSDMMGRPGQPRPADLLAGGPRRGDRATRLARAPLPAGRHDDLQRLRRLRAPGPHPDASRGGRRVRAGRRSGLVPGAAGARARRHGRARGRGRLRAVGAGQALRAGDPGLGAQRDPGADGRDRRAVLLVSRPTTPRRSRSPSSRRSRRRCSSPTITITTWVDVTPCPGRQVGGDAAPT